MRGTLITYLCFTSLLFLFQKCNSLVPQYPSWPMEFRSDFYVQVKDYGPSFKQFGMIFYKYTIKAMRADYIEWCLPLFDNVLSNSNFSCQFLFDKSGNAYYIEFKDIHNPTCCIFAEGLGATQPDWLKNTKFNGTEKLKGRKCNKWWFDATAEDPYYGYWEEDGYNTPVRFLGISSIGETTLDYLTYEIGMQDVSLFTVPHGCTQLCSGAIQKRLYGNLFLVPLFPLRRK